MSRLSRRSFLGLGRAEKSAPHSPASKGAIVQDPGTLPAVISWLADSHSDPRPPSPGLSLPLLRPPGAIAEEEFLERCTRCSDCSDACPHAAIRPAPMRFRQAAGSPWIDPASGPCYLCEDLPCISACSTGALTEEADVMGTAEVNRLDCLGHGGTPCTICQEHCPIDGTIAFTCLTPTISRALCTGCGICHHVCPAPTKAIYVMPTPERRTRTERTP